MLSDPHPASGVRQTAKEYVRLRLLALLDIPALERKLAHDTDRLAELQVEQRQLREHVDQSLASGGPPGPEPLERAWRAAAEPILERHAAQTEATVAALNVRYEEPILGSCDVFDLIGRLGECIDPTDCRLFGASQLTHVLLMIEEMRDDGVLTDDLLLAALVHDLGKVLLLTDEDPANIAGMNEPIGDHEPGVGLDRVTIQWNHDELGYLRLVDHVPDHIAWLVRYHSVDPATVTHLHDDRDRQYTERYLRTFFHYDHQTKSPYRRPSIKLAEFRQFIDDAFPRPILF